MLPDDCTDCPICGIPMLRNTDYCDACWRAAMRRLGYHLDFEGEDILGKHSQHAHWRIPGLLAVWAKNARKADHP